MTYGVSKSKSFGYDSRPLTLQSNVIDKHITNSLHYFKALKDKLDALHVVFVSFSTSTHSI